MIGSSRTPICVISPDSAIPSWPLNPSSPCAYLRQATMLPPSHRVSIERKRDFIPFDGVWKLCFFQSRL